jgi:hypothetical protein
VFSYDLADQVTTVKLNVANLDTTVPGTQPIIYDAKVTRTRWRLQEICAQTTMSLKRIARRLEMGSWTHVSNLLRQ